MASTWSRRVHTLERIADKVGVTNEYCAYTAFTTKPHLRYLFQTYQGIRGSTLFLSKDRLFLTKSIMDSFFDMDVLREEGVLTDSMALHDANRGDKLNLGGRTEHLSHHLFSFILICFVYYGCGMLTVPESRQCNSTQHDITQHTHVSCHLVCHAMFCLNTHCPSLTPLRLLHRSDVLFRRWVTFWRPPASEVGKRPNTDTCTCAPAPAR